MLGGNMKLWQCPSCNGSGGEIDVICDDGTGPQIMCGFCSGKGKLTRRRFFVALGYTSWLKRQKKQYIYQMDVKLGKRIKEARG